MNKIITIDCDYTREKFACAYLVHDDEHALFIDNNTSHSVPILLDALKKTGLTTAHVQYVIITHVHLDHAGGSSALMKACPNAVLLGHPRATPHMIDPAKLIASAEAVYGQERFAALYGRIEPVPAARVRAVGDGEKIAFGAAELRFLFTRGHANHHVCIVLSEKNSKAPKIFTGDAFGLAYPALQGQGLFIFPSTSPTDFDALEAKKSIQSILDSGADEAFLTHYGSVTELANAAKQMDAMIDFSEGLLSRAGEQNLAHEELVPFFTKELRQKMRELLQAHGLRLEGDIENLLRMDLDLNAQGLAHVFEKRRRKA
jgi:glyoxylase-like metal-dependent hydrolase (beta-lactamase superfamily II)